MAKKSIVFKILGVVAGLAFMAAGFSERSSLAHMKAIGKTAVVDPIKDYTRRKSIYTAEFSFTTEKGEKITAKHSFPSELIADFEAGRPVSVLYDPNRPHEFVFEKEKASWYMVIGGIVFAIAALLFA
ncbi:DUF3592 domain-containing protein [Undibacterium sp. TC4M20W]|uniref:DUF3592 domain-containing protein n=1 Tax=Undibacterium sp. TC4M20W TaxID=3413052 RepID=UPI003BEFCBB6